MFAALLVGLIVIYAGLLILAAASRASDPQVKRVLRYVSLAPLASVVAAKVIGAGATLLLLIVGVGGVLAWAAVPRGEEGAESPLAPALEWTRRMADTGRQALYAEPVYASGPLHGMRADVVGALLGLVLAVAIVLALM